MDLLCSWLNKTKPSTSPSATSNTEAIATFRPAIDLTFPRDGDAHATRQSILDATAVKRKSDTSVTSVGKVDDLADCFLQAAAWVAWELNIMNLQPEITEFTAELEKNLGREIRGLQSRLLDAVKELHGGQEKDVQSEEMSGVTAKETEKVTKPKATKRKTAT